MKITEKKSIPVGDKDPIITKEDIKKEPWLKMFMKGNADTQLLDKEERKEVEYIRTRLASEIYRCRAIMEVEGRWKVGDEVGVRAMDYELFKDSLEIIK
jgi:hypothetical protein